MRINFRSKEGFVFTQAIENYIREKLKRVIRYFRDHSDLEARIVCRVVHELQTIEITIPTKHITLRAEVSEHDLYAAIDLATDKLEGQIRKHKDKINTIFRQREGIAAFFKSDEELDIKGLEAEIVGTNLFKSKKIELKLMSAEEAAMNMELIDHDFYVYLDKDTHKVSVVYKRTNDNDYAVIETE